MGLALPLTPILATPSLAAPATVDAPNAGVAADVNGDKILTADLSRMVASIKASDPAFATASPEVTKALANIRVQVLDELITTKLLSQEAKRRKISADAKQVQEAITAIKTGSGFKTDAEFTAVLAKEGKTMDDLRTAIADELVIRELSKQLTADVAVSGEDIGAFYRANLDQFTVPEGVKARHILLAVNPDAPASAKEIQRKRAQDLIKQLNNKADFVALAKTNSDDQSNKNSGGDLGAFTKGQMVKAFEDAAFAAQVGKVVGPVETSFGLHIIRVDEKIAAKVIPLSEVQADPRIKPFLLKQKVQKRLDESIAKLKTAAKIKKYV
jgi:peptidyl-prolyl cis-trans isomerase C